MNYCMYENTVGALEQIFDSEIPMGDLSELSSDYEQRAYKRFWKMISENAALAEQILEELESAE